MVGGWESKWVTALAWLAVRDGFIKGPVSFNSYSLKHSAEGKSGLTAEKFWKLRDLNCITIRAWALSVHCSKCSFQAHCFRILITHYAAESVLCKTAKVRFKTAGVSCLKVAAHFAKVFPETENEFDYYVPDVSRKWKNSSVCFPFTNLLPPDHSWILQKYPIGVMGLPCPLLNHPWALYGKEQQNMDLIQVYTGAIMDVLLGDNAF